ncbi:MAG: aminotransferase class I/II [Nitrososphaera sp.]|nr:aminotransferase class I/II [Nitrososphaera sp.]
MVGNGATEIIYNFCRAVISRNMPVLVTAPTFGEYEAAARLCGARMQFFKTMDLEDDIAGFLKKIPRNGIVFVCNPNNPTGLLVPKNIMMKILTAAQKKGTLVFVDECFVELADPKQSLVGAVSKFANLFVLRSLTKSFGLAGLRIGYGIGDKKMVSVLDKIKIPWNVSGLAQEAAVLALSDVQFLRKTQKLIATESEFLKKSISEIADLSCFDSQTNFLLIKTKIPSKILQKKLLRRKILIRDCSTFRGLNQNYIRIAVRTRKENLVLIRALENAK